MKFLKNTFIFFLTSFCMLLVMEFYFTQTEMIENLKPEFNDDLGVIYLKNQKFSFFSEGWGMGHTNKHGFLGKEYSINKKENTFRIVVLGDSYVQGLQVLERNHFISQFQNKLKQFNDSEIEVLNFGVSGYNLSSMYCYYKNSVQKFKPDLILFCIDQADLKVNSLSKAQNLLYPYLEIKNDSLIINYDFRQRKQYNFYHKIQSAFRLNFTKIARNIYFISNREKLSILFDKFHRPSKRKKQVVIKKKQEKDIPKVSKLILQELKKQNVIIVYRDTINDSSMDFIENQIGLSIINLNDTLNSMKQNNIDPNYWKITKQRGHWNHDGHRAVGLFLAKKTQQMNLLSK